MGDRRLNICEAKTHLSKLVAEIEAGATVTIARDGRPIRPRKFGTASGEDGFMADDFDSPLPDDMLKDIVP